MKAVQPEEIASSLRSSQRRGKKSMISVDKITVIGVPYDQNSSFLRGPAAAPDKIREAFYSPSANLWAENGVDLKGRSQWQNISDLETEAKEEGGGFGGGGRGPGTGGGKGIPMYTVVIGTGGGQGIPMYNVLLGLAIISDPLVGCAMNLSKSMVQI